MSKDKVTKHLFERSYAQGYWASWTPEGFSRLRTYLGRAAKGNDKIFTTPFGSMNSITVMLDEWKSELESIKAEWPSLWEFEIDLSKKVGPMSVQKPLSERLTDIASYYDDILLPSIPVSPSAINAVVREFSGLRGLRLRKLSSTLDVMRKSTSSGNPYFAKRKDVILGTLPCRCDFGMDFSPMNADLESVPTPFITIGPDADTYMATAVIGWRGQEGGPSADDVKQRVIWMFPFSLNINELQVYQPLIQSAQRLNLVPAWISMESVDKSITALFDSKDSNDLVVCTDFTRFDQHFNADCANATKSILERLLVKGDYDAELWLNQVFPAKFSIPICWEINGEMCQYFVGAHGMASGSGGTNADETLLHRSLQYEVAQKHGQRLNLHSQCLGDDGILTYPGIQVEQVTESYSSHGQVCNPDKQYASTVDCVYLRRWHHKDYRTNGVCTGVYSTCRALGRMVYLERFMDPKVWGPQMIVMRELSILENCKYHPLREQFVEFCMKRDEYGLGTLIPGFLENIEQISKKYIDYMPDLVGYNLSMQSNQRGMADWWIVNYLRSMS